MVWWTKPQRRRSPEHRFTSNPENLVFLVHVNISLTYKKADAGENSRERERDDNKRESKATKEWKGSTWAYSDSKQGFPCCISVAFWFYIRKQKSKCSCFIFLYVLLKNSNLIFDQVSSANACNTWCKIRTSWMMLLSAMSRWKLSIQIKQLLTRFS